MKVNFVRSKPEAANIITFYFKSEQPIEYTAGQYIELSLPHSNPDRRGVKHWFTLSSPPGQEYLSITTKFASPSSTFKQTLRKLEPGAEVNFTGPMGDFVLPKMVQTPLLFIAGGIGITPYHSILGWLINHPEERHIRLIYGVNNEDEIIFQDTINKSNARVTYVVSEPTDSWGGERGKLSAELIYGLADIKDDWQVFLSGPEPMVETVGNDLLKKGLRKSQLAQDFFHNYTDI